MSKGHEGVVLIGKLTNFLRRGLDSTLWCFQTTMLELDAGKRILIRGLEVYNFQEIFREKFESRKQALKDGMEHMSNNYKVSLNYS